MASGEFNLPSTVNTTLAIEAIRLSIMRQVEHRIFLTVTFKFSYILNEPGKFTAKSNKQ